MKLVSLARAGDTDLTTSKHRGGGGGGKTLQRHRRVLLFNEEANPLHPREISREDFHVMPATAAHHPRRPCQTHKLCIFLLHLRRVSRFFRHCMMVCFSFGIPLTGFSLVCQLDSDRVGRVRGWVFMQMADDLVQDPHVALLDCLDG